MPLIGSGRHWCLRRVRWAITGRIFAKTPGSILTTCQVYRKCSHCFRYYTKAQIRFWPKYERYIVVLWDSSQLSGDRKGRPVADWEELNSEMKSRASWDNLKIQPSAIVKDGEQILHLVLHGRHNPFQGELAASLFHPWGRKWSCDRRVRLVILAFWPAHSRNPLLVSLYLCEGQWL